MNSTIEIGSGGGVATYPTIGAFPASAPGGTLAVALDTGALYIFNTGSSTWVLQTASTGIAGPGSSVDSQIALFSGAGGNTVKAATGTGVVSVASGVYSANAITASRAVASDGSGIPVASATTAAQLGYLSTTTSDVQTQINGKQASGSYITALTSDVSASGPGSASATVNSVGGSSAANIHSAELAANAATNANTASTIVKRDASGNFSAGTITASLTGNASGTSANVTGVVAVANGGTNSSTALNNNRNIVSSGGKIVESAAITASSALASDTNGLPVASATTATELGYVSGVTGPIQTQLNKALISTIGVVLDGAGGVPATGSKGYLQINYNCTINSWTILADQTGSAVMDVKRSTYAGFPTTTSIIGGGNSPTLSAAQKNTASVSGWTSTTITAGDIIEWSLTSITTCTRLTVELSVTRT